MGTSDHEVSFYNLNGVEYKCGNAITLKNNSDDYPTFGIITGIIKTKKSCCFLLIKKCLTLGLNKYFKGYQVLLPDENTQEHLIILSVSKFIRPLSIHKNVFNYNLVSLRDMQE